MSKNSVGLTSQDYVHLHNHTQYSLLDGLTQIGPMIDYAHKEGMQAIAKTDHGTLSGTIEFYKLAKEKDVKPIVGMEIYVASRKHTDRDPQKDKNRFHLILLAMNETGYKNLMRLSTIANLKGFYYFPRVDRDLLKEYNEGLIALSACMGSELGDAVRRGGIEEARKVAEWYKNVFGDRYYLEVQDHGHPKNPLHSADQNEYNDIVLQLAKDTGIPAVVTCDAHYLSKEDQDAHEILLCVGTGSYLSDEKRMSLKDYPLHVESPTEIIQRWGKSNPELIINTKKIASRCELELDLGKILIPKFTVPKQETEKSYLEKLVYKGLGVRYAGLPENKVDKLSVAEIKKLLPKAILERGKYELGVIDSMGFNGYFLIIWDFIKWGKDKGIVFGPGRGSAAGSIIAYALRITEIDPLKYDLLFERFLNPDRISMPDIDIDIQDSRRDEVIQYCVERYGDDRVANIVTFGRMAARAAVRDVARVLEVPYSEADKIAKLIPPPVQGRHIPLSKSIVDNAELKTEYNTNPTAKKVIDMAIRLEGTVRNHGVHAAGVVIAPDNIVNFVPLEMAQKGVVATQYPMGPIEDLGLLKMDFLGLSNLTTIKNALRIIKKVYGKDIDIGKLSLNDKATYDLLGKGDTTGVFQLESAGMKRYLKELRPTVFEDIIAMVALYRPGPMQFIDDFIARKHGKKAISYFHPKMENALKNTYGVLVYQEQVMQISKDLCGFSGGQADVLRKGIGKKIPEVLAKMKVEFIDGAVNTSNADRTQMEQFWHQLEDFAAYCFNKSHAACYALIAYWTAYLKAHYPAAFMAAVMTSDFDNTDRLAIEIAECKRMGLSVLPPDINQSYHEFAVVPSEKGVNADIRYGMDAIKNVGHGAVAEILRSRDEDGEFSSLTDFMQRVNSKVVNKKAWESLAKSGAFDRFSDRGSLVENIESVVSMSSKIDKEKANGQTDLFAGSTTQNQSVLSIDIPTSSNVYTEHDYLKWERELLGLYLSKHPLEDFELILSEKSVLISKISSDDDGKTGIVGGIINDIRQISTKNGQQMAFVKLEDYMGDEIELVVFPNTYKDSSDSWVKDKILLVTGKVNGVGRAGEPMPEPKLIVDSVSEISHKEAIQYDPIGDHVSLKGKKSKKNGVSNPSIPKSTNEKGRLYIRIKDSSDQSMLMAMKSILDNEDGIVEAVLVLGADKQVIKLPQLVSGSKAQLDKLQALIGAENVVIQ